MTPIETPRLVLRNFSASDAADLFAYLHQPRASCFLSLKLDDMAAAEAEAAKRSASDEHLAVCLKATNKLIGDLFAVPEDDTVAVGWNFNGAFAGLGFASEAAHAVFEELFTARHSRRLYAYVDDHNIASQRLCERLGMRREGLFEDFISFATDRDGRPIYENTIQFAMLRREWEQRHPAQARVPIRSPQQRDD